MSLSKNLKYLYKTGKFSDITLKCDGKSFACHRSVLATRSKIFDVMFGSDDWSENQDKVIELNDASSEALEKFLLFLYTDELTRIKNAEVGCELLILADKYDVDKLKERCENELLTPGLINQGNALKIMFLADKMRCFKLSGACASFICGSFKKISDSFDWRMYMGKHGDIVSSLVNASFNKNEQTSNEVSGQYEKQCKSKHAKTVKDLQNQISHVKREMQEKLNKMIAEKDDIIRQRNQTIKDLKARNKK